MEKINLTLDEENYHYVLRQYGPEGARRQAINMVTAQKLEMTEENLYSCLSTLESDLAGMFS
jgi:hypothetical protein